MTYSRLDADDYMGWQISRKKDKYRIWSNNTDSWLTGWIDRIEAIKFCYEESLYQFKQKVIEQYLAFPHHWGDYDNHKHVAIIIDTERNEKYREWMKELLSKTDDEYYKFIDEAFDKIIKELNKELTQ